MSCDYYYSVAYLQGVVGWSAVCVIVIFPDHAHTKNLITDQHKELTRTPTHWEQQHNDLTTTVSTFISFISFPLRCVARSTNATVTIFIKY